MTIPQLLPRIRPQLRLAATLARRHLLFSVCAASFCIALVLRLYRLGAQSLWLDEGGTWAEITGKSWSALLGELFSKDAAYPLYHILLKAWVGLAGDAEWSLRLPSALAGAAAVAVIALAAIELQPTRDERRKTKDESAASSFVLGPSSFVPLVAALLFGTAPFALWYAQDAKVYSLLMLVVALELWALLRAIRRATGRAWLLVLAIAAVSIFVHRLALLTAAAAALTYVIVWPVRTSATNARGRADRAQGASALVLRIGWGLVVLALIVAGVAGTILAVRSGDQATSGHIPAGPLAGLWLSFVHFGVDRGDIAGLLGLPIAVWLLPHAALTLWGLARLVRDMRRPAAVVMSCMFVVPLMLFALALAFAQVFEARYATIAFPAWLLVITYPFVATTEQSPDERDGDQQVRTSRLNHADSFTTKAPRHQGLMSRWLSGLVVRRPSSTSTRVLGRSSISLVLLCSVLLINALVLFQPKHGLFSGAPVKEQWREAIIELARRVHPDDLIILHPYYAQPMWQYYAPRVTPDPLPLPVSFLNFREGYLASLPLEQRKQRAQREYEPAYNAAARGKRRALLLIAPDHARTIDPPDETRGDKYGWLGLRFQYSADQRTWPCGGATFVGVEVMCQSYPEGFKTGVIPEPATPLDATFGGELRLRGYSLDLAGGLARPGGTLPITLYWKATAKPPRDYHMFLHLCRDCTLPPLANDDGPPLNGYGDAGRTTTWRLDDPLHDERALCLPQDLAPGSYTLLLGVYPEGDASAAARLPVDSEAQVAAQVLGGTRLVLGQVSIAPARGGSLLGCRP